MRIGILTFHRCINYGSYWQTRCLVEGLRARGHEPVVLDHASRRIDIAEWKCAFRPTLPQPVPRGDRPHYRAKIRRFFDAIAALPLSAPIALDAPQQVAVGGAPEDCDVVLVGSDEVWNLSHPWYGRCTLFYGDGLRTRRLVSYAASFGNHEAGYGLAPDWAQRLGRFDRISVRDQSSGDIVARATGERPPLVLDPCLQFPPATAVDVAPPERDYLAVYGHGFSPAFVGRVRRWARTRGLPIVSIGYRNDWADRQWLQAGPHEFAAFIAGASAVATNFFHGCVFALRHGKPFVCEESHYRSNKVRGLMATVGGQPHLQPEGAPADALETLLDAPPVAAIGARIEQVRTTSERFLDRALVA